MTHSEDVVDTLQCHGDDTVEPERERRAQRLEAANRDELLNLCARETLKCSGTRAESPPPIHT